MKNKGLEYQFSYWEALATNNPQKAKAIEKEYQVFAKEAQRLEAKKNELVELIKLATNSLKSIDEIYLKAENGKLNIRKTIDFLEKTLDNRTEIMNFIEAYKKATQKTRRAFRRFAASNNMLEEVAGTTEDPNFNYHLFIESCAELQGDINNFLAKE